MHDWLYSHFIRFSFQPHGYSTKLGLLGRNSVKFIVVRWPCEANVRGADLQPDKDGLISFFFFLL